MFDPKKYAIRLAASLTLALLSFGCATQSSVNSPSIANNGAPAVYGQVVLYHAKPGRIAELERVLNDRVFITRLRSDPTFINERVLKPIDNYSLMYITYTKFSDSVASQKYLNDRLASVRGLVRRPPEHHLARLDAAYTPAGVSRNPTGREFGRGQTGQNAHLGLFIPQADYLDEYFKAIDKVKQLHVDRRPEGWIGDDLLSTEAMAQPNAIAPDSPRPRHASKLSLNYGEYDSFRQAEIAYINRKNSGNPDMIALQNVFYGTLQVPSRYYIMEVLGNY